MPESALETPELPNNLHKGIPLHEIIDCIENKNLSITQTAKLLNSSKSNISTRLSSVGYKPDYLTKFKNNRADILASYQEIILNSLTPKDVNSASMSQKVTAYAILYDKERLERGQSTENIAYADITKAQEIIDTKMEAFESKYNIEAKVNTPTI
jgi:hypothetical protein